MKKFIFILALALVSISANAQYITEYQSSNGHQYQFLKDTEIDDIYKCQMLISNYEKAAEKHKNAQTLFWSAIGIELAGAAVTGLSYLTDGYGFDNPMFLGGCVISSIAGIVASVGIIKLVTTARDKYETQLLLSANGIVMTF